MKRKKLKALKYSVTTISQARAHWFAAMYFCELCFNHIDKGTLKLPGMMHFEEIDGGVKHAFPVSHILRAFQLGHNLPNPQGGIIGDRGKFSREGLHRYLNEALILYVFSVLDDQGIERNFKRLWYDETPVFRFVEQARHCIIHARWKLSGIRDRDMHVEWQGVTIEYDPDKLLVLSNTQCLELIDEILKRLFELLLKNDDHLSVGPCFYSFHLKPVRDYLKKNPEAKNLVENYWGIPLPDFASMESYDDIT